MLQLYVKADHAGRVRRSAKELDLGDFVGAAGRCSRPARSKRALKCEELRLLTKAIRPLPGKVLQEGADVTDVGLLYRQRYLDFIVHPEKVEVFRKRRQDRLAQSAASSTSAATSRPRRACSCRPTAARRRGRSRRTTTRSTSISSCASPPSST